MTSIALAPAASSPRTPIAVTASGARLWTGRIVSGLLGAFLVFDAVAKIAYVAAVAGPSSAMGLSHTDVVALGLVLFAATVLYLVPRTAVIGAVLLTGYFGGAMATHVTLHTGAFSIAFAFAVGAVAWLGLHLRDPRVASALRTLVAPRR